jgi:hypothetical protein
MTTIIDERQGRRGPKPGSNSPKQAVATATTSWNVMPDWVLVLAEACDRTSQNVVAKRLKYSGSAVSSILRNNYKGRAEVIEKAVRGVLMAEVLECPVLGELRKNVCLDHQKRAQNFAATSTLRVRMYQSCRGGCMHSRLSQKFGGSDVE